MLGHRQLRDQFRDHKIDYNDLVMSDFSASSTRLQLMALEVLSNIVVINDLAERVDHHAMDFISGGLRGAERGTLPGGGGIQV